MVRDPTLLYTTNWPLEIYNLTRKWFTLTCCLIFPILFLINAPFGRFSPNSTSRSPITFFNTPALLFDGIKSWIFMENVAIVTFIYAFLKSPLTFYKTPLPDLFTPQSTLTAMFLLHYLNRAILSPLRTPSRSKSHIIVTLVGVAFNLCNGYIMGSYLSSPFGRIFLGGTYGFTRPSFLIGVALWAAGFVGNIVHDEILLDIRRKANQRKAKESEPEPKANTKNGSATPNKSKSKSKGKTKTEQEDKSQQEGKPTQEEKVEYYGIPHGLLYKYISYPNYFCEWIEWLGFAIAASPFPIALSFTSPLAFILSILTPFTPLIYPSTWIKLVKDPSYMFAPHLAPPWIFLVNEILTMLPRAIQGHRWYKMKFGESYPKERNAVIPFVL